MLPAIGGYLVISIIIVIIIIYYIYGIHDATYEDAMYGLWVSADGYNNDANVSLMRLFIGYSEKESTKKIRRNARLLIDDDITDQDITISYDKCSTGFPFNIKPYKITAEIEFTKEPIWDNPIILEFDFMKNNLRIYSNDELLGFLYKDNELTDSLKYIEDK